MRACRQFTAVQDNVVTTFPNSPFQLHQPFAPAGDQPEAIARLSEGLGDGLAFQTLLESNPRDLTANFFLGKAAKYISTGVPTNWVGVEEMSEK